VTGVRTTLPVLQRIVADADFRAGRLSTGFLDRVLPEIQAPEGRHATIALIVAALVRYEGRGSLIPSLSDTPNPWRWGRPGWPAP
jgi:acetyl/propionyl-CoA carboxylase alpha subunit